MRARRDIGKLIAGLPVPDELGAQRRTWRVVRAAFEAREPVRWPSRRTRPLLMLAAAAALGAAALSPPGRAVIDAVRDAIGRERVKGVVDAQEAVFSLPTAGRLLVNAPRRAWILRQSGSKRLLGRYAEASWSPRGLFVVAVRRNELRAIDPKGNIRWTLARRNVHLARWAPSGFRIAYLSGSALRVVAGDGSGDRLVAGGVAAVAPAWRPGAQHVVAFADPEGRISVVATDARRTLSRSGRGEASAQLAWSADARRLFALGPRTLRILDARGRLVGRVRARPRFRNLTLAVGPRPPVFAVTQQSLATGRSEAVVYRGQRRRTLFSGPGAFTDLAWSPDGRWLLLGWRNADQWLFVDTEKGKRVRAYSNVTRQFSPGGRPLVDFPDVADAGWCCS